MTVAKEFSPPKTGILSCREVAYLMMLSTKKQPVMVRNKVPAFYHH
jgi:hypothetical protein